MAEANHVLDDSLAPNRTGLPYSSTSLSLPLFRPLFHHQIAISAPFAYANVNVNSHANHLLILQRRIHRSQTSTSHPFNSSLPDGKSNKNHYPRRQTSTLTVDEEAFMTSARLTSTRLPPTSSLNPMCQSRTTVKSTDYRGSVTGIADWGSGAAQLGGGSPFVAITCRKLLPPAIEFSNRVPDEVAPVAGNQ